MKDRITLPKQPITDIIPPMITPFKENGEMDYDAFVRNIEKWNNDQLGGYLVLGSNSETPYLNEEEKLKLIELTVQVAKDGMTILAGTGLESTGETIHLTNKAAKLGAHAALVLTPFYYGERMSDKALIHHFTTIADASDIPILIYNVPKFTHLNISADAVRVLSRHPNIVGMKDSKGDVAQLREFLAVVPTEFNLIAGSASIWYLSLSCGIQAGILALSNCTPESCAEIQSLFVAKKYAQAEELQSRMLSVNKATTTTYGVAGLKYAATLMGYEGGHVRSPLLEVDDVAKKDIRKILVSAGLLPD